MQVEKKKRKSNELVFLSTVFGSEAAETFRGKKQKFTSKIRKSKAYSECSPTNDTRAVLFSTCKRSTRIEWKSKRLKIIMFRIPIQMNDQSPINQLSNPPSVNRFLDLKQSRFPKFRPGNSKYSLMELSLTAAPCECCHFAFLLLWLSLPALQDIAIPSLPMSPVDVITRPGTSSACRDGSACCRSHDKRHARTSHPLVI